MPNAIEEEEKEEGLGKMLLNQRFKHSMSSLSPKDGTDQFLSFSMSAKMHGCPLDQIMMSQIDEEEEEARIQVDAYTYFKNE
jgi:hypothetical protein